MVKNQQIYKDRQIEVDNLIANVTEYETKIYEFESKTMEMELHSKTKQFDCTVMEEKCNVLMDESKSIVIQYNTFKEYGTSNGNNADIGIGTDTSSGIINNIHIEDTGVPGSVPLSPGNQILNYENIENEKLLNDLYTHRSQLYIDMELLYNKAILVQTRGYEEMQLIKQCQDDEINIKIQLDNKMSLIETQLNEENNLIEQARCSLIEYSQQLSNTSIEFAKKVSRVLYNFMIV